MAILSIKASVTRLQAAKMLGGRLSELRHGKLRGVLDFYIPYAFFKVSSANRASRLLAIDGVTGQLDLYEFDWAPTAEARQHLESCRLVEARLNVTAVRERLEERLMRMVFLQGFFRLNRLELEAEFVEEVGLPYWVGVYERGGEVGIEVIDALRGRLEGAKVREMVTEWFLAQQPLLRRSKH